MKEKIKKFREVWAVPRYRGLIKLGIGIAFMILVYFLIGGFSQMVPISDLPGTNDASNNNVVSKNILDNYKNMESCEYNYLVEIDNGTKTSSYKLDGTYYKNNYYFTLNNQEYYIKEDTIYLVDSTNKKLIPYKETNSISILSIIDIRVLNIKSIHTFLTSSDAGEDTKYKDGKEVKKYIYTNYENKKIDLTLNGKNNIVESIDIDFTNYYSGYKSYKVTATYKNVNNIAEYNKDYSNYTVTVEGA